MKTQSILSAAFALALSAALTSPVLADDTSAKAANNAEVEQSTSHNPLTGNTTTTVKRKSKRQYKNKSGEKVNAEENSKVEKTVSDDGKKTTTTSEQKSTEETNH